MDAVERSFAGGKVFAPIAGVVATNVAYVGQSLWLARQSPRSSIQPTSSSTGTSPTRGWSTPGTMIRSWWYSATGEFPAQSVDILPVSDIYAGRQPRFGRDRQATQIARIRFNEDAHAPPLNSTVTFTCTTQASSPATAERLIWLFGLD